MMLQMDGFKDCVAGVVERFGQEPIICYDKQKVLGKLQGQGMDEFEAEEYFVYNQIGAWMGDGTPCFINQGADWVDYFVAMEAEDG